MPSAMHSRLVPAPGLILVFAVDEMHAGFSFPKSLFLGNIRFTKGVS